MEGTHERPTRRDTRRALHKSRKPSCPPPPCRFCRFSSLGASASRSRCAPRQSLRRHCSHHPPTSPHPAPAAARRRQDGPPGRVGRRRRRAPGKLRESPASRRAGSGSDPGPACAGTGHVDRGRTPLRASLRRHTAERCASRAPPPPVAMRGSRPRLQQCCLSRQGSRHDKARAGDARAEREETRLWCAPAQGRCD